MIVLSETSFDDGPWLSRSIGGSISRTLRMSNVDFTFKK